MRSMTAFASRRGALGARAWAWEIRGVNARGLDLRLRLPEVAGLEAALRPRLSARLARGNITLSLRLSRDPAAAGLALDTGQLDAVLAALSQIEARALDQGLTLAQPNAADVLAARGVTGGDEAAEDGDLLAALLTDFDALLDEFDAMRAGEGRALAGILSTQLDGIADLATRAATAAEARKDETRAHMAEALRRVLDEAPDMDEPRIAQELALIAVKQDVTEEIDRLHAHVAAARDLLAQDKPAGRRLDFLAQEFNREANTLCSKSQNQALTALGLELKAAIEQMREQVQNVE